VPPIPLPGQGGNNDKNAYKETYQIWSNFRLIGNVLLIIVLLVVVFGESIGGGLIDAYTVKKILPRLLIGAILINLSIYIVAFGIDVTNVVGAGLGNLLQAPFPDSAKELNFNNNSVLSGGTAGNYVKGSAAFVGTFVALGAAVAAFEWVLLAIILVPTLLVFFITVVVLMIRSGLIMLLVYTAPVAFALWCLPNTEQYFKKWWSLLFRTLLIFPIIALLFALGNIVSYTVGRAIPDQTLGQFLKVIGIFAPFYLIPFSFQFAGGVIGGIAGLLNKRVAKPAMGRLSRSGQKKLAEQRLPQRLDRSKLISGGLDEDRGGVRGGLAKLSNKTIGNARAVVKGKGLKLKGRIQSGKSNIESAKTSREEEVIKKTPVYRDMMKSPEAVTLAAMSGGTVKGARDWMNREGHTGDAKWENALGILQGGKLSTALSSVALKEGIAADGIKARPDLDAAKAEKYVEEAAAKLSPGDKGKGLVGDFKFNAKSGLRPELSTENIQGNGINYVEVYKNVGSEAVLKANPKAAKEIIDAVASAVATEPELLATLKNDALEIQGAGVKPENAEYILKQ
jgi:hypothetical protein